MKKLFLLGILLSCASLFADGPVWETDLEAAKARAEKENKTILINFTGSDWCGWCKCLVLLELVYLGLKFVDYVVSVFECYYTVLHLLLKLLQFLLHALDLQVIRGLEILKLTSLNFSSLLSRP